MARRIICDICGKQEDAAQTVMEPWCGFMYIRVNPLTRQIEQSPSDLCPDCAGQVFNFIKEQKNERQSSDTITDKESVEDSARPSIKIYT